MSGVSVVAAIVGFSTIVVGSLVAEYGARAHIAERDRLGRGAVRQQRTAGRRIDRAGAAPNVGHGDRGDSVAVLTVVAMGGVTSNQIDTFTGPFHAMRHSDVWVGSGEAQVIPVNIRFPESTLEEVRAVARRRRASWARSRAIRRSAATACCCRAWKVCRTPAVRRITPDASGACWTRTGRSRR